MRLRLILLEDKSLKSSSNWGRSRKVHTDITLLFMWNVASLLKIRRFQSWLGSRGRIIVARLNLLVSEPEPIEVSTVS